MSDYVPTRRQVLVVMVMKILSGNAKPSRYACWRKKVYGGVVTCIITVSLQLLVRGCVIFVEMLHPGQAVRRGKDCQSMANSPSC